MTSGESGRRRRKGADTQLPAPPVSPEDQGKKFPWSLSLTWGTILKLLFLASVNMLAIWSFPSMWSQKWWPGLIAVLGATALIDWAFRRSQQGREPGGHGVEWVDLDVLRRLRRRSLAVLRREVEELESKASG